MNIPQTDYLEVSKSSRAERGAIARYVMPGLKLLNYGELGRVDRFYLDCQDYRDYSRDSYDKMTKPARFRQYQGKCGIKLDKDCLELRMPPRWHVERQPILYPMEYGKEMDMDKSYRVLLRGTHSRANDTFGKR